MDTFELLEKLSSKPKEEIQEALTILMLKGKLDYITVSESYVYYLEHIKEDRLNQLVEAETCVMESFMHKVKKNDSTISNKHGDWVSTQRRLYLLNKSNRFNMNGLNKEFNYIGDDAKEYSWYERNKNK